MTSNMCLKQTLLMASTISDILTQIDHKSTNWTFLILKVTYKVIQHHSSFEDSIKITPMKLYDAIKLGSTLLLLNNIKIWNWSKADLSDLDRLSNSIKCISWQLINIILNKPYAKEGNKLNSWSYICILVKSLERHRFFVCVMIRRLLPLKDTCDR